MPSANPMTWDLDSIFPGGSESSEFADFRKLLKDDLDYADKKISELKKEDFQRALAQLGAKLKKQEQDANNA